MPSKYNIGQSPEGQFHAARQGKTGKPPVVEHKGLSDGALSFHGQRAGRQLPLWDKPASVSDDCATLFSRASKQVF
jgi:hypothetical protein